MDSFATADTLRIGLMAASRIKAPSPPQPAMSSESKQQQQQNQQQQQAAAGAFPAQQDEGSQAPPRDAEGLSLSSVRPGHSSSQIYDPDAALSVAALLAKEMEEERLLALQEGGGDGGAWASARHPCRPEVSPPGEQQRAGPKPLLKRSASMNSMVSSRMGAESTAPAVDPVTNRRSLPRGYGGPMIAPGAGGGEELVVVDAKASLRRLYDAIEGRGMVAIKRNPNGKGRSRVMVRSRIKDKSIGWAHVLPPFTRKFVNVKELTGAQRSSRVVTVKFKTREPVSVFFHPRYVSRRQRGARGAMVLSAAAREHLLRLLFKSECRSMYMRIPATSAMEVAMYVGWSCNDKRCGYSDASSAFWSYRTMAFTLLTTTVSPTLTPCLSPLLFLALAVPAPCSCRLLPLFVYSARRRRRRCCFCSRIGHVRDGQADRRPHSRAGVRVAGQAPEDGGQSRVNEPTAEPTHQRKKKKRKDNSNGTNGRTRTANKSTAVRGRSQQACQYASPDRRKNLPPTRRARTLVLVGRWRGAGAM